MKRGDLLSGCATVFMGALVLVLLGRSPPPDNDSVLKVDADGQRSAAVAEPRPAPSPGPHRAPARTEPRPAPQEVPGYELVQARAKAYPLRIDRVALCGGRWAL
ncbi:MAG: hypothetical protein ACOCYC_00570 [bacterium]